jgi:hypothetical protein
VTSIEDPLAVSPVACNVQLQIPRLRSVPTDPLPPDTSFANDRVIVIPSVNVFGIIINVVVITTTFQSSSVVLP